MKVKFSLGLGTLLVGSMSLVGTSAIDMNITPDALWGDGNINGSYTVDRQNGIELGLRGKIRFNATGQPENTFNSNNDGTYSFSAGVAPTKAFPRAVWSYEWSINSDWDGSSGLSLDDLNYRLDLDTDISQGTDFSLSSFDLIHAMNPDPSGDGRWDHAIGDNSTGNGDGAVAATRAQYESLLAANNVAQNSWQAHWYIPGFNPTLNATYTIQLSALDKNTGAVLAKTSVNIIVGTGGAPVPDGGSMALLLGGALSGLGVFRRFATRKA